MRSTHEVVAHVEERIANSLGRPEMYASSPEALEDVLSVLDGVRRFAAGADPPGSDGPDKGYTAFLVSKGCGSANYTGRRRLNSSETPTERELFRELVDLWREYLASDFASCD